MLTWSKQTNTELRKKNDEKSVGRLLTMIICLPFNIFYLAILNYYYFGPFKANIIQKI